MRNFKFYMSMLAVSALLFTSCSKDDPGTDPDPKQNEMVSLSFSGALKQFNKAMANKQTADNPPSCAEGEAGVPSYIVIALREGNEGDAMPYTWVLDESPESGDAPENIEVGVIPSTTDNYLTFEADELELPEGNYTLERFAVYNAAGTMIWLAPRGDENYGPANFGNFVADPLPNDFLLEEGTKHYEDVEVLCYDEAEARQYGYLFFDFQEVPLTYLCIFGNECDIDGRHFPSHFRVKIWEYPAVDGSEIEFTDANALVNEMNEVRELESGLLQADPLCFPLPDRDGENLFYGEIWLLGDNPATEVVEEEYLIRRGDFTDEQTKSDEFNIDNDENLRNYWHFREGPFCGEDSSPCLLSSFDSDIVDDFDDPAEFSAYTGTSYDEFMSGEDRYGEYLITDDASELYGEFTSDSYDGNMLVFDGDPERRLVYYTIETPEVCAGDTYYVTMDLRDISVPDDNHSRLRVNYRSGDDDKLTISQFTIDELPDNDSQVEGWKTVGFIMEARKDGQLYFFIRDVEDAESGNDFAMDNVRVSNDPTIMNGISGENLNPNN